MKNAKGLRHALPLLALFTLAGCQQTTTPVSAHQTAPDHHAALSRSAEQPGHAWLEISRGKLTSNIHQVQQLLGGKSTLCAILKGDAYGHDLSLVTPVMMENNVQCIGIASNAEVKTVRDLGFKGRLMRVRSASPQEMAKVIDYNVEELIGNPQVASELNALAKQRGKTLPIHLGLNSGGMSRNGLDVSTLQGIATASQIAHLSNLKVVGIMTHYPMEDEAEIRAGLKLFNQQAAAVIAAAGLKRSDITLHTANTWATLRVPESRLDLVRVGGIFYGDTTATHSYQRVMTYKSNVAAVNAYKKGSTVGYDRTYTLKRDSLLANIPVGYADGYLRDFSNKGHVLIGGQRYPVVGKTSMNTIMVDVTGTSGIVPGAEVVLFGKQGNAEVTGEEVEEITDVLFTQTSILWGATVPRVLVD
ncbi:alanine racemase [Jejubacter calystegiae]|uniref:Alanine racemase, catabolic n=1 Tax=Jejubacter calystegiae TaxID=2579935 RepID=A0A4P8YR10_9ENTR|nr:alanine racemase [Jejubacter calystegiae]QCT22488.1 alanine racemase [Jejubacter calystegiae]